METGVRYYCGIPKCGKTTLAKDHLRELVLANGWPCLIIDSEGVSELADIPHARSVREAIEWVWGAGQHAAYEPEGIEEVEALIRACRHPGRVNVALDEGADWLTARRGSDGPILKLMRHHRHAQVNLLITTQHYTGDIPQPARSCAPRFYVFRCSAPAVLDQLKKEGLDPEVVANLPQFKYLEHYNGF